MDTTTDTMLAEMESNLETLYMMAARNESATLLGMISKLNLAIADHVSNGQLKKYSKHTSMAA